MKTGENVLFEERFSVPSNITLLKQVLGAINLILSVKMDRCTRYYVNQSGGEEIGPVYRASFRVQRGNGIGSFTLQRGVTGTARMLHALTHSSISRQVREQM